MRRGDQAKRWPATSADEATVKRPASLDFHSIYERWFDEVSRWVTVMGSPEAEREDLVQDVFLVVHRRLPDFDGENVAGWLYRIARRRVRDFRRLGWVKQLVFGNIEWSESLPNASASPADSAETNEKRELFERLVQRLSESERAALMLFEVHGYSGERVAQVQGIPVNTVWARVHSARRKLRASLARFEKNEQRRT
jgi:RNA polymerase sigma-70 factor (ECF subfamily)